MKNLSQTLFMGLFLFSNSVFSDNSGNKNNLELTLKNYSEYLVLVNKAIKDSYNKPSIVVDKKNYSLFVYDKGEVVKKFPIELGKNPFSDKVMQGDYATPEGSYMVKNIKKKGESKYYMSFDLNYPTKEDYLEFNNLKKKGLIPNDSKIGGNIEIHGSGTGFAGNYIGINWTKGCIALSNSQIEELSSYVKVGTQVSIVKMDDILIQK